MCLAFIVAFLNTFEINSFKFKLNIVECILDIWAKESLENIEKI
jgi:hypothetical protein